MQKANSRRKPKKANALSFSLSSPLTRENRCEREKMGLISAKETKHTNSSGRGMGFLLVFFPDHNSSSRTLTAVDNNSPSSPATATLFRSRSSRLLLSKAQSTISICILLLFLTLFFFTLSTFEPSSGFPAVSPRSHRRFLLNRDVGGSAVNRRRSNRFALQGMGTLFLRGTKSMHDLVVAHIAPDTTEDDLRLFMRLLHRSGVTSKSDVVLLFHSPSSASRFAGLIEEENDSFSKLVDVHRNSNSSNQIDSVWGFNVTRFMKKQSKKEATSEPLWGRKTHRASYNDSASNETESAELTHGSVVGFDVTELDPENSLSGFMDHVPMNLRRWACYPMLLGRVRRNFKHVMLVDAKTSLFLGDPLTRIRNRSPESVLVFSSSSKHSNKKTSDVNPAVLIGGAKGIRRLSSSMHTEIVRATIQQQKKKKNSVSESVVLSQLVGNVHMTKNFEVISESSSVVPEASSLAELRTRNSAASSIKNHDIIQRGNTNSNHPDIMAIIMKRICSSELYSSVYSFC